MTASRVMNSVREIVANDGVDDNDDARETKPEKIAYGIAGGYHPC